MSKPFRIWCGDGGGTRGIVPATITAYLETTYGKPAHELFDMFVGTSTSGIIACALTHPNRCSAHDVVNLFRENAATIFPKPGPFGWLENLFTDKYPPTGLASVLNRQFGSAALSSATRPVCVTAFDLQAMSPAYLGSRQTPGETFFDAALATSAGPTYFPAHGNLIDGGVIANNPSLVALGEAAGQGANLADIRILSLGTGRYDPSLTGEARSGELGWAANISGVCIDGVAERDAAIVQSLLGRNHLRIQPNLPKVLAPMDTTDPKALAQYEAIAAQAFSDNEQALQEFFK